MISTSTQLGIGGAKELLNIIFSTINETQKQIAYIFWSDLLALLVKHWLFITVAIFVILAVALVRSIFGWWDMLGSILYHLLYFGILLVVGLIWGPEIFISDYFHEGCIIILYPICYFVVGLILDWTGVRNFQTKHYKSQG